jgi:RNA polymerase sigma-70 factor
MRSSVEQFCEGHASLIERLRGDARPERWDLSPADFDRALYRSVIERFGDLAAAAPGEIDRYLESLSIADLTLAAACERGTQSAWVEFLGQFRPVIYGAAVALTHDASRAKEITDALYADLYGLEERDGTRRSLFQYFHGRSSLGTWLRSVVARTFVDGYRAEQRGQSLKTRLAEEAASRDRLATAPADPDRGRQVEALRQALSQALAALEPRDRLRLAYYYVHELTLARIGRLVGEHESTVSRKLEQTRSGLRQAVERSLENEHGLTTDDVRACVQAALDAWAFDLGKELAVAR